MLYDYNRINLHHCSDGRRQGSGGGFWRLRDTIGTMYVCVPLDTDDEIWLLRLFYDEKTPGEWR